MTGRRLLSLVIALGLLLPACASSGSGSSSGGKVTLEYWATEEGADQFFHAAIAKFEKLNPNIDIHVTTYPEANYGTKVETALAAGRPPDLGSVGNLLWLKEGKVLPLDNFIKQQNIDLSHFNPSIVGDTQHTNGEFGCAFEGHLYCLGSYLGAVATFYNKDMLKAAGIPFPKPYPPMDIEKFVNMACKLTDKSKNLYGAAYGDPVTVLPWETWFSKDGRTARLTNPLAVQSEQVMADGIKNGCAPSPSVMDPWEQGNDFFTQKKLAMVVTDFQGLKKIEKAGINYGVTAPPTAPGVEPFLQTWTDGVGVFAGSDHAQEAMKYIGFLATTGQKLRVKITGDVPLSSEVAKQTNWAGGIPGREEALQVLPHARPAVFIPNRWDTVGPMFDAFGAIVSGEKTAQQAMADAQPNVQQNLDKAWATWEKSP